MGLTPLNPQKGVTDGIYGWIFHSTCRHFLACKMELVISAMACLPSVTICLHTNQTSAEHLPTTAPNGTARAFNKAELYLFIL